MILLLTWKAFGERMKRADEFERLRNEVADDAQLIHKIAEKKVKVRARGILRPNLQQDL